MELSRRRTYNLTIPLDFLYKNKIVKNIYNLTEDIQGYGDIEIGIFGLKDADISKKNNVHWVLKNLDKSSVLKSGIGDIKFNNISIGEYKLDVYIDDSLTANYKLDNIISNKYLNEYATLKFGINLDYITSIKPTNIKPTNTDSDKGTLSVSFDGQNNNFKFKYKKVSDNSYSDYINSGNILLTPGEYDISYNDVEGYSTPSNNNFTIVSNNTTVVNASYNKKLTLSIKRVRAEDNFDITYNTSDDGSKFTYDVFINGKKTSYGKDISISVNNNDKIIIVPIPSVFIRGYFKHNSYFHEYRAYAGISNISSQSTLDFISITNNNIVLMYEYSIMKRQYVGNH